jgi:hypothetical protein
VNTSGTAEWSRAELAWPLCLAAVALALNLFFYSGVYMSDDMSYLGAIQRLAAFRPIDTANIAHTRLLVNLPAALTYALSGSLTATILGFCLYHPLIVVLTYLAGRVAFTRGGARASAALVAVSPIFYFFGGTALPDNCLATWLAALLAFVVWVLVSARNGALSERRELTLWCVAGVLTGVAYSAKEPGLVMAVPVSLSIFFTRLGRKGLARSIVGGLTYALGLGAWLVVEAVLIRVVSGHWTIRLLAGVGNESTTDVLLARVSQQGVWPLERLEFWYEHSREYFGPGLWVILAAQVAGWWVFRGFRRVLLAVVIAFWVWPFLYLTFGTTNFSRYVPPPIQHPRYYAVCMMPALLVTGAVLVRSSQLIRERLGERRAALRILIERVPALLVALWGGLGLINFAPRAGTAYRAPQTKSALAAFKDARELYPERPVVFSEYLSVRLAPLLSARSCDGCVDVLANPTSIQDVPERPFVILAATKGYDRTLGPAIEALKRSKTITVKSVGLGSYRAPWGRMNELKAAFYPVLGALGEPTWERADPKHAIRLLLVSDVAESKAR